MTLGWHPFGIQLGLALGRRADGLSLGFLRAGYVETRLGRGFELTEGVDRLRAARAYNAPFVARGRS
jgi:hypothetical protein